MSSEQVESTSSAFDHELNEALVNANIENGYEELASKRAEITPFVDQLIAFIRTFIRKHGFTDGTEDDVRRARQRRMHAEKADGPFASGK